MNWAPVGWLRRRVIVSLCLQIANCKKKKCYGSLANELTQLPISLGITYHSFHFPIFKCHIASVLRRPICILLLSIFKLRFPLCCRGQISDLIALIIRIGRDNLPRFILPRTPFQFWHFDGFSCQSTEMIHPSAYLDFWS